MFLTGTMDIDELVERGAAVLGKRWRWLRPLVRRMIRAFQTNDHPLPIELVEFLLGDEGFARACSSPELRLISPSIARPKMAPAISAQSWTILPVHTEGDLAHWLGVSIPELEWFADLRSLEGRRNIGRLRHYHYRPLAKRFGQIRMIEAPKPRLKVIQRNILSAIIQRIPTHSAAHGFHVGRSIQTFASAHVGRRVVLRIDLKDFFPSISAARIRAVFRTAGYPERVASLLTGLCTNSTPPDAWDAVTSTAPSSLADAQRLYRLPHLPQGAPTSPALANLCVFRLDCRLSRLAKCAGAQYTRYADDLAFSGDRDFERKVERFHLHVCASAMEEGFDVHHRKTRIMRSGVRQHLAGMVVNERMNLRRNDFDRLKATLTNCARHGPESQNRLLHENFAAHLLGRISFVEMVNPKRGARLREIFDRIDW